MRAKVIGCAIAVLAGAPVAALAQPAPSSWLASTADLCRAPGSGGFRVLVAGGQAARSFDAAAGAAVLLLPHAAAADLDATLSLDSAPAAGTCTPIKATLQLSASGAAPITSSAMLQACADQPVHLRVLLIPRFGAAGPPSVSVDLGRHAFVVEASIAGPWGVDVALQRGAAVIPPACPAFRVCTALRAGDALDDGGDASSCLGPAAPAPQSISQSASQSGSQSASQSGSQSASPAASPSQTSPADDAPPASSPASDPHVAELCIKEKLLAPPATWLPLTDVDRYERAQVECGPKATTEPALEDWARARARQRSDELKAAVQVGDLKPDHVKMMRRMFGRALGMRANASPVEALLDYWRYFSRAAVFGLDDVTVRDLIVYADEVLRAAPRGPCGGRGELAIVASESDQRTSSPTTRFGNFDELITSAPADGVASMTMAELARNTGMLENPRLWPLAADKARQLIAELGADQGRRRWQAWVDAEAGGFAQPRYISIIKQAKLSPHLVYLNRHVLGEGCVQVSHPVDYALFERVFVEVRDHETVGQAVARALGTRAAAARL